MQRRNFIVSSIACIATASISHEELFWSTLEKYEPLDDPDPLRPYLLANMGSSATINDLNQAKSILGLPSIYIHTKGLPSDAAPDNSSVQNLLQSGGAMKRAHLEKTPEYFSFLIDQSRTNAKLFASGLSEASDFVGLVFPWAPLAPPVALALKLGSLVAEEAWNRTSTDILIAGNPFERNRTLRAVIEAAAAAAEENPAYDRTLKGPAVLSKTGIDFSQSSASLVNKLPDGIRALVADAISESRKGLQNDVNLRNQSIQKVLDRFSEQLDGVERQTKAFNEFLKAQHSRQELERERARIASLQNDIHSGIAIATFVLGIVTGDRNKANEVGRVLTGIVNIGFSLLSTPPNYLGAIAGGLNLFGGMGPDPMTVVLQQVQRLGKQIEQLRTEMHARFDRLEQQQQEMLLALGKIFSSVNEGFAVTNQRIRQLEDRFEDYWSIKDEDDRRDSESKIIEAFKQGKLVLDAKSRGWESAYLQKLPLFVTHAVQTSRKSYYRGASIAGPGKLTAEVKARKNSDRLLALLPGICRGVGVSIPNDPVNPFAFALGAEAYMQADLLLGAVTNSGRKDELLSMWKDGLKTRNGINTASSKATIDKLVQTAEREAGVTEEAELVNTNTLVGAFRALEDRWIKETLKPFYTFEELDGSFGRRPDREIVYTDFSNRIRVKDSALDACFKLGLIELTEVGHWTDHGISGGQQESWRYNLEIKKGPHSGLRLGDATTGYERRVYLNHPPAESRRFYVPMRYSPRMEAGQLRGVIAERTNPVAHWTMEFVEYCEFLLGYYYLTEVLPQFPQWLVSKGFDGTPLSNWSDSASALRLVAAIRFWRTSETAEVEGQTDTRNISLLSRTDEVINWLNQQISVLKDQHAKDPKLYTKEKDPRTKYLYRELQIRQKADLAEIGALPEISNSKSVPVIDSALRKLAGYMTAHEIAFSLT